MMPRPSRSFRAGLLLPLLLPGFAASADSGSDTRVESADPARLLLERALEADRGSGVQVAIVRDGELLWSVALGSADLEGNRPMSPTTRLRIGSVSKVWTAALVARLAEDGRLDLDAPVGDLLPELPQAYRRLTPRLLGAHLAGVRHYDFSNLAEANNLRRWEDVVSTLTLFTGDPLVSEPGAEFHYSSFGYNLLGAVASRAAGEDFPHALETWVTGPSGFRQTVVDRPWALVSERGRFYTVPRDGPILNTPWRDSTDYFPSGGLLSTAEDLARFTWEVFRGRAFAATSRHAFETPVPRTDGSVGPWTFGWELVRGEDSEVVAWVHGGLTNGATAEVRFLPESDAALAVIANYNFWFEGQPEVLRVALEEIPDLLLR